jgi:hypothetical protein
VNIDIETLTTVEIILFNYFITWVKCVHPVHVLMRLYPIDKSLVCKAKEGRHVSIENCTKGS